jgi:hypothetical protein
MVGSMETTVEDVVRVFVAARIAGKRPVATVIQELCLSKAEALRLITHARQVGLLKDRDDSDLKGLLVAHALGVRYEDLVDAVLRYADGELKVSSGEGRGG